MKKRKKTRGWKTKSKKLTPRRNLLPRGGHTDNDALPPALVARLQRRAHDTDITSAVKRVVAPAVGHLDQLVHDALAFGQLGRVDKVGGAEARRPLLLGGVHIHHNDLAGLLRHGALHDAQADAARAEHGHVAAGLDGGRDARRAVARRDAAPQQARAVHGRVRLHRHHRDVGHHRVLAEGRRAHEV